VAIGRERLPSGYLAFLEDPDLCQLAIQDLHAYAVMTPKDRQLRGMVYRLVDAAERDRVNYRLQSVFGVPAFASKSELFCPAVGFGHVIDSEHIAHACNRHSDQATERGHGHIAIQCSDFQLIPEVTKAVHIVNFQMSGTSPRIIYSKSYERFELVVVEELRRRIGLVLKTIYKQKR